MIVLSPSEHDELLEHLQGRRDIWVEHKGMWVRSLRAEEEYALTFVLRPLNGMVSLIYKPLLWQEDTTREYVLWLLDKYTAYTMRQQIVHLLAASIKPTADIHTLSAKLADLHGGTFRKRFDGRVSTLGSKACSRENREGGSASLLPEEWLVDAQVLYYPTVPDGKTL